MFTYFHLILKFARYSIGFVPKVYPKRKKNCIIVVTCEGDKMRIYRKWYGAEDYEHHRRTVLGVCRSKVSLQLCPSIRVINNPY